MQKQQLKMIKPIYLEIPTNNPLRTSYRNEIIAQLEDQNIKVERKYILKMLLNAIERLYCIGIYIYPNIIELFQINGLKSSNLFSNIIFYITEKVNNELKGNVKWINHRSLKKGNTMDKNIILCFLLFTYREHFIEYLQDFFIKNKQGSEEKIKNLSLCLQRIINDAPFNNDKDIQITIVPKNITESLINSKNQKKVIDREKIFND